MILLFAGIAIGVLIGSYLTGRHQPLLYLALAGLLGSVVVYDRAAPDAGALASGTGPGAGTTLGEGVEGGVEGAGPDAAAGAGAEAGGVAGPAGPGGQLTQPAGLSCDRERNGGATDTGVSKDKIKLAATVVQSGIGASFLGQSPVGMQAVVRKVNSQGGVCGRLLDLKLVDDGWEAPRGLTFIRNFINEGTFALPVTPSSEGLTAAIESKDISNAKIPVVGTDGMLIQQYRDPYVWPVATATISTMRVMARHGYEKGARRFGIVYDKFYKFGREGAEAFKDYLEKQPGAQIKAYTGILPGQASYSSDIQSFNSACNGECDMVALLLEPSTAETWIAGRPQFGTMITSGSQTLFNERFASNCGKPCAGMLVWTGYNPPVGNLASTPAIAAYVQDVKSVSPTVDVTNQFLQGSYLGMTVFVEALKKVGPQLTRERLKQALDSMDYPAGISSQLAWKPGNHHANIRAQAFSIVVAQGSFAGFRDEQTGFIADPALGN
ncbi:MAG TPA: ABC transporter substrate-binding protein [Actinomycetota bacterium]|nr:ABC transporter substrate-binding protein [Actinomycetota bacterium]